jgi:hypothetical protein
MPSKNEMIRRDVDLLSPAPPQAYLAQPTTLSA